MTTVAPTKPEAKQDKQELSIKRAHITLMKHPQTAQFSGVMLMGVSEVCDGVFTAYTDGVNKRYSRWFLETIDKESKKRGLVLHENLHVALKQVVHGKAMFMENPKMANLAADFVVNDVIHNIDGTLPNSNERVVELPDGAVYDPMFHDWSMRQVYEYLKKNAKCKPKDPNGNKQPRGGGEQPNGGADDDDQQQPQQSQQPDDGDEQEWDTVTVNGKTYDISKQDTHDFNGDMTAEEAKELGDAIDRALREGGILAGRMGGKMPRVISDLLEPKVDWREALREFVSASMRGKDEYTWRKLNKRQIANDFVLPSIENETMGELIVAIDTSGSIGSKEISEFASELVSICQTVEPELVRVLWWDTMVHGMQEFRAQDYDNIKNLLKPVGGGGTRVSSVSEYIVEKGLRAECVLVFTDGYVEGDVVWNVNAPTLWMVTVAKEWMPPSGKKVMVNKDE